MAFSDQIASMQAAVYAQYGIPAQWTPKGGQTAVPVTVLPDEADKDATFGALGRRVVARGVFKVRASDLASALAAATLAPVNPAVGDQLAFEDGSVFRIVQQPLREDPRQLEWTLECSQ